MSNSHTARGGEFELGIGDLLRVVLCCWPFIRTYFKHMASYALLMVVFSVSLAVGGLIGADLFANKIMVGDRLQPVQATLLFLDDSYVSEAGDESGEVLDVPDAGALADEPGAAAAELPGTSGDAGAAANVRDAGAAPGLTQPQRKVVRNRFLLWTIVGSLVILAWIAVLPYYSTWIWHQVNQTLRVRMLENAEHLSLTYHAESRAGDAIYRVYQDSMMIVAVLERLVTQPLSMLWGILTGLFAVTFFDPWLALTLVLTGIPVVWLAKVFTPHMRMRSRGARVASSELTSRLHVAFYGPEDCES